MARKAVRVARRAGRRLPASERRRELVRVAADLMTSRGVDGVQFAEVAAAAGVTRPLVYRFFPNRQALIIAVLEDFTAELTSRFGHGFMRSIPGSNVEVARVFVEALCDLIDERGAGPWHLLDSKGPDPEIARIGQKLVDELMAPWRARLVEAIEISPRESMTLARMIVAAGRAAIELWSAGSLTRAEVVRDTTRGVSALVEGFAAGPREKAARGERRFGRKRSP
ncbi:MAG TPA: TetR/AcrR family transcriptional regulator [Candidatus Binatia bacterium]|nr:TetR/AcrR family transcriptional regulator [Candidatus Binatia bacterium]